MHRIFVLLSLFFTISFFAAAQTTPADGSSLNYRLVGFSFPVNKGVSGYQVQIAKGNYSDEKPFLRNIFTTTDTKTNKVIITVTDFGQQYTWRTVCINKDRKTYSGLHHFKTMTVPEVNPDSMRLRIINNATAHKDDYVFLDGNKALYDMTGRPVWFFPDIDDLPRETTRPRDLKVTPFGTITFLVSDRIYEINYNGDILWKGPENGKIRKDSSHLNNLHHHEFTRLANGHYMALAFERSLWKLDSPLNTAVASALHGKLKRDSNNVYSQKMLFGTIVEFDQEGKMVWKWNGSDYFKGSDLFYHRMAYNLFDLDNTHENAFYFDEKSQVIYISFRDINRIVKIQYPSGKLLASYGAAYTPGGPSYLVNGLFCGQHAIRRSMEGYLYMFNNNLCNPRSNPTVEMLEEPKTVVDSTPNVSGLKKIWEYVCPMDEVSEKDRIAILFNSGGNALELADSTIFVCMGSSYGKVFIVNRDKQLLWCAQPEKWDSGTNKWTNQIEYRASIMSREDLEHVIWNEPLKN